MKIEQFYMLGFIKNSSIYLLYLVLINYIIMRFNKMILKQDRSVVTSQIPKYSNISNKEFLVPADAPILLYRKYLNENSND
jgi:hypothetical protein